MKTKLLFTAKFILLLSLLLNPFCGISQTKVLENLVNPGGLQIINDYLYFTEKIDSNQGKLSRVNIKQANPSVEIVYQGFDEPVHTAIRGSEIYVLELRGNLYKLDLTQNNPTPTFIADVAQSNTTSRGTDLIIFNDIAYISLIDEKKIVTVNLNDNLPTNPQDLLTGFNLPGDLLIVDQTLYYSDFINGNGIRLYSLDLNSLNSNPTVIENSLGTANGFVYINNIIYCIEHQNSFSRISEINLTNSFPTHSSSHINGLNRKDEDLILEGNTFYVATHINPGGFITKYESSSLSNNEFLLEKNISIYPNPATSFINIKLKSIDQEIESVTVFNVLGKKVVSKNYQTSNAVLDTNSLPKGIYFVKVKTKNQQFTKKIIIE